MGVGTYGRKYVHIYAIPFDVRRYVEKKEAKEEPQRYVDMYVG